MALIVPTASITAIKLRKKAPSPEGEGWDKGKINV
jgi:hypothetical protein